MVFIMEVIEIVRSEVENIVMRKVGDSELLLSSGLIDSIGVVDLAVELELKLGVSIDARDIVLNNFDSIDKITTYIASKKG